MKAGPERASTTASRTHPASRSTFFQPVQAKLTVNAPGDRHEREADAAADRVMRASDGVAPVFAADPGPAGGGLVQRSGVGTPVVNDATAARIRARRTGGRRLDRDTRRFMEARFGADFGRVRVHDDAESARLAGRLGARAFTTENHVFFGAGQYRPGTSDGRRLLAHELTHTIQQGAAVQRSAAPVPAIGTLAAAPSVQRFGLGDVLDYFADKANLIPGFRLLTIVLGFNPVNMAAVERSAGNVLRALVEVLPGASLVTPVLERYGVFAQAGAWIEQQLAVLGDIGARILHGIDLFIDSLGWTDILDLGDVWARAKAIFTRPIGDLIAFFGSLVVGLLELVRQAILRPLAELLRPTRGYDLLCAILGRDPVTGDPVPRTAQTVIGGFMKLIGREDVWQNIQKGNAVARAWKWFEGALAGLLGLVLSIPARVFETLRSLTWQDVVTIAGVLSKVAKLFLGIAADFVAWAGSTVLQLIEIVFSVVAPGVMPYLTKARAAFRTILENPIGFVRNLVRAGRLGFELFSRNIGDHLKSALIKWIVGPLADAGVYIPKSFTLGEIVKLVLSVLGLTWQNVRAKLVKIVPEPVLVVLEKTTAILVKLVKEGPAVAWEEIKAELTELKGMLIEEVTSLVSTEIVKAAVKKVVGMLNPAGAVIQAILAVYDTVMFFVERGRQIAETVGAFVNSIAAIAAGQVAAAGQRVEQAMARSLVVVLGFLARFAGLGAIPKKIVGIVQRIRKPIDKGLDRIVAWLGALLKKLGAAAKSAAADFLQWWKKKVRVIAGDEEHTLTFEGERDAARLVLRSEPQKPSEYLDRKARTAKAEEADRVERVEDVKKRESAISDIQTRLGEYDGPTKDTAAGRRAANADKLSKQLDTRLQELADKIITALVKWQVLGKKVGKFDIPRRSFTVSMKKRIAAAQQDKSVLVPDSKGRIVSLAEGLDRRHIVSSNDIATHYESYLETLQVSEAKLYLEQRGSNADARIPVTPETPAGVVAAAKRRHTKFFGYAQNIFIGDSSENRSIQEALDGGRPDMQEDKKKLREHVSRITREWALHESFRPTER